MNRVSIIIPVKAINSYVREAIPHLLALDYEDFEILVFPDEVSDETFEKTRIIASGHVGPAEKRDMAMQYATGAYFAFIDDDAYPRSDWLKNAIDKFTSDNVGAVGGPAVTVESDSLLQRAGGKVYESFLCSGGYTYRYLPGTPHEDDDLPSVNLIVKRSVFESVGGFDSSFYPGEDTKLCLDITKKLGMKLLYCPDVLVYHHRRALFRAHLKQVINYARHRGYFARVLPATSMRVQYFLPSLFTLGVILGPVAIALLPALGWVYGAVLIFYFALAAWSVRSSRSFRMMCLAVSGIFATHIGYGICFIQGLFSKKMIR